MTRLFMNRFLAILLLTIPATAAQAAQSTVEALRAQLSIEERLLERAQFEYREARALERDVLSNLQTISNRQDVFINQALREARVGNTQVTSGGERSESGDLPRQLRSAERELAGVRETAFGLASESADRRRDLLARAARIGELRHEIARYDRTSLVDKTGLDGRWEIDFAEAGITGTVEFDSEGTLVTGSYRLSDGAQGSIRGTLTSSYLVLDRIDWSRGFDITLRGQLNAAVGRIEGSWLSLDVSGGAPTSGNWTARRISR